ncbi:hypothetical protein Tel_10785 [Candidatus Tenderia electrophaga]|uniref:Endonuclease/exonuclease/phosphatase domain-containing protein n=1 Tax=Candidatus Tenderia electrophaga TaxID=1748243 RepID=A0A0S2TEJ8_9GAMM|nr:hypothetical protein Tel_10785 [Candidatus Tenderia electrophaga]
MPHQPLKCSAKRFWCFGSGSTHRGITNENWLVTAHSDPPIIAGDFNDVAWSYTTNLFQKTSGLLDSRVGRGMYNTYNARNPILRWPLDHVFHSDHFKLVRMEKGPAWGSDHFPIFIELSLEPGAEADQEESDTNRAEEDKVDEKIEDGEQQTEE